jgi:hypothetical protein
MPPIAGSGAQGAAADSALQGADTALRVPVDSADGVLPSGSRRERRGFDCGVSRAQGMAIISNALIAWLAGHTNGLEEHTGSIASRT